MWSRGLNGGSWESVRIFGWSLALKERIAPHVLVSPYEIYEVLMEINTEHQGMLEIRVRTSGKQETYSKINIMKNTPGEMVGNMDPTKATRVEITHIEIPDPTSGYLRGSSMDHRKLGDDVRNICIEHDLDKLVYIDRMGWNESEMSFVCESSKCDCRYPMRYTREWGRTEDRASPLAALFVAKVSIQEDIPSDQLGSSEITDAERQGLHQELDLVDKRWESGRNKKRLAKIKDRC